MISKWFKLNYNYQACHWLYGRCLGLVTLIAFLSYWHQADALIGEQGLSPWTKDLANIEQWCGQNPDLNKWHIRPTLVWLEPLANHHLLFVVGTISAFLLAIGILPTICGLVIYLCYLSLMVLGEPFLSFQWDILLCETLLLSLPFLPLTKFHKIGDHFKVSWIARYLIIALLAKLMLESGIVKFTSFGANSENTWRDLTALDYHYWTQPLPHGLSAWIHSLPQWIDQTSLYLMYGIELILPFFLFLPGIFRRIGVIGQVLLQIAIILSGNYGFFNLLTLCLCIPLMDDQMFPRFITKHWNTDNKVTETPVFESDFRLFLGISRWIYLGTAWFFFGITSYGHLARDLKGNQPDSIINIDAKWIEPYASIIRPTRAFNSYGLFRVMTTTRPEIIIEGSLDGHNWRPYEFRWKPSDAKHSPRFAGPHMPRIDWQMWFEGLNYERYAGHSFSLMLYHKFLNIIALGGSMKDFNDFSKVLGPTEYQNFIQAPPQVKQRVLENYNSLLNAFNSRSLWFGKLLEAIFEHRPVIMKHLGENLESLSTKPKYLRVSLAHYTFAEPKDKQVWNVSPIDGASVIISKNVLGK
ncbi:MAG: lipase maturation factor family protein [Opitutae bacterium]